MQFLSWKLVFTIIPRTREGSINNIIQGFLFQKCTHLNNKMLISNFFREMGDVSITEC